jgi:hypothetical protein
MPASFPKGLQDRRVSMLTRVSLRAHDKERTARLSPAALVRRDFRVIRLAISCDICGAEKKQTNHWFVAYEHAGELRIGGWNSRYCKRAGSRHLCGQTCLHKLVDEFMAETIAEDREMAAAEQAEQAVAEAAAAEPVAPQPHPIAVNASLTSRAAYEDEFGSSARLISAPAPAPVSDARPMPVRSEPAPAPLPAETPKYASHQWRTSAWERERRRESSGR